MKYFQMFANGQIMQISELSFESGGSERGVSFLFFLIEDGRIRVRSGLDTPRYLALFDNLEVEDDSIQGSEVDVSYIISELRMALTDVEAYWHDLSCAIAREILWST